jgi:hypothetical protein
MRRIQRSFALDVLGTAEVLAVLGLALLSTQGAAKAQPDPSKEADRVGASKARLKQLGVALRMYAEDWDMVLPPMESAAAVKKVLYLYVPSQDAAFLVPQTDEPYQPNAAVSRHQMVGTFRVQNPGQKEPRYWTVRRGRHPKWLKVKGYISDPASQVAFYEPSPAADGTRGVVFLDGRVTRVSEAQWQRLMPGSGRP